MGVRIKTGTKHVCNDVHQVFFLLLFKNRRMKTLHKIGCQPALETKANWCVNSKGGTWEGMIKSLKNI